MNSSTSEKVSEQCFVKSFPIWSSPPSSCFKTGEQKIMRNLLRQTQQINQGKLPSSQNISTKENLLNLLEAALVPNFWSNIFNCAVNGGRTLFQKGRFAPMMLCWPPGRVTDAHSGWKESSFSSLRISRGGGLLFSLCWRASGYVLIFYHASMMAIFCFVLWTLDKVLETLKRSARHLKVWLRLPCFSRVIYSGKVDIHKMKLVPMTLINIANLLEDKEQPHF